MFIICSLIGSEAKIAGGSSKSSSIGKGSLVNFSKNAFCASVISLAVAFCASVISLAVAFCASVISLAVAFCASVTGLNNLVYPL